MYVCGPTVYDVPHLGHGRFSLVFDILRRYLLFRGLDVTYVSNVTDIDDNIINRAKRDGVPWQQIVDTYEKTWWDAMDGLGVMRPTHDPHATAYVDEMVELIKQLFDKGLAYVIEGDGVYLRAEQVEGYGLLAGQPLDSLKSGARIDNDKKDSPVDFALWKLAKPDEPSWDSPWGAGRPGWHTECVVMSLDLLGEGFDLHGGGRDLAFPHHENERAQSVALGKPFARHWMHNGWVEVEGVKMSKSLNNFTSLTDLLEQTGDGRTYRLLVLRAHYRSPTEVTGDTIRDAAASLERLDAFARRFAEAKTVSPADDSPAIQRFVDLMDDDLDTPAVMAMVFDLVRQANVDADKGDTTAALHAAAEVFTITEALGLPLRTDADDVDEPTGVLIAARNLARAQKDWAEADRLRDELQAMGWVVEDGPDGTTVHR